MWTKTYQATRRNLSTEAARINPVMGDYAFVTSKLQEREALPVFIGEGVISRWLFDWTLRQVFTQGKSCQVQHTVFIDPCTHYIVKSNHITKTLTARI